MMWNHGNNGVKQREQKVTEQSWELTKNNDERRENCANNRHNMYFEIIILQNVFISIFRYFVLNLDVKVICYCSLNVSFTETKPFSLI